MYAVSVCTVVGVVPCAHTRMRLASLRGLCVSFYYKQGQGLTLWHVGVLISVLVCGWLFDRCSGRGIERARARDTGRPRDRETKRLRARQKE
jgi:hypothetical protein